MLVHLLDDLQRLLLIIFLLKRNEMPLGKLSSLLHYGLILLDRIKLFVKVELIGNLVELGVEEQVAFESA